MKKIIIIFFMAAALFTAPIEKVFADDIFRSEIIITGDVGDFNGVLRIIGGKWFLFIGNSFYQITMCPDFFIGQIGFVFLDYAPVEITGSLFNFEIIPIIITLRGTTFRFRDNYGKPLWIVPNNNHGHNVNTGHNNNGPNNNQGHNINNGHNNNGSNNNQGHNINNGHNNNGQNNNPGHNINTGHNNNVKPKPNGQNALPIRDIRTIKNKISKK